MLLSYSFVNNVDRNEDLKLSKGEWLDFARAWFLVIDETHAGEITHEHLTTRVRNLITPPSMRTPTPNRRSPATTPPHSSLKISGMR